MPTPFQIVDGTTGNDTRVSANALHVIIDSGNATSGGNVTVTNGNSTSAVNIQDGGNSITVDYATTGSGNATGALRVELANNGTGVLGTVGNVTTVGTVSAVTAGNITVNNTAAAAAFVISSFLFSNITTATTTTVKSGAGILHGVNVNTLGTIASTVTIYDNTAASGTKIGIIDSLTLKGFNQYDIAFATGLTLVTTGTSAPDITVSYR